jgi:hypothetical protein
MLLQGRAILTRCVRTRAGGWGAVGLLLPRQYVHPTIAADADTCIIVGSVIRVGSACRGSGWGLVRGASWCWGSAVQLKYLSGFSR